MASPTIQFKRGLVQNLPGLRAGEPGFATDRSDFYVGFNSTTQGNKFFGSSRYWIREDGTNSLKLNLVDKTGNNGVRLAAPDTVSGITTYTLPETPTDGYFLKTDADGVLSWTSVTAGATFENAILTGVTTIVSVDIQNGSINGTTVGLTTAAAAQFTTLGADSLNVSGIATVGSLSIGSTQVISSAFQLQNILSLDATTIATIESAVANAPNTFTDLTVTGISTFNGNVNIGDSSSDTLTVKATTTFSEPVVGTISTATRATHVDTTGTSTNADYYVPFVANSGSTTSEVVRIDAGLKFNPSTNNLTVDGDIKVGGNDIQASDGATNITLTSNTLTAFAGDIKVGGNDIQASDGTTALTLSATTGNVAIAGDLKVGGNDIQASDGTTAITLSPVTGNVGVSSDLTISGNLYVNGTTTQVNTTSLTVEDTLVELGMVDGNPPASDLNKDLGLLLNYYSGSAKKAAVYWDDSVSRIALASDVSEASSVLTANAYAALEVGSLYINNACTGGVHEVIGCIGSELNLQNIVVDGGVF